MTIIRASRLNSAAVSAGLAVTAVGAVVFAGWLFDLTTLKNLLPQWESMNVNTSLSFIFAGAACAGVGWSRRGDPRWLRARWLALVPLTLGCLNLAEYILGVDAGLNELLFQDDSPAVTNTAPGRMSVLTSLNFIIVGTALIHWDRLSPALTEAAALTVSILGFVSILGYLYGVNSSELFETLGVMALHASLTFELLAVTLLTLLPASRLLSTLLSDTYGGYLARRLFPAALLSPAAAGFLQFEAQKAGLFGQEFGLALSAAVTAAFFCLLALWLARSLDASARLRVLYEKDIASGEARYEELLSTMREMAYRIEWDEATPDQRHLTFLSSGVEGLLGYQREEMLYNDEVWRNLRHPDDVAEMARTLNESLETGQLMTRRYRILHADGQYRWLEDRCRAIWSDSGAVVGYFGIAHDVTDRVRAEELEERARVAEESDRVRTRVLAVVSHELRTPLSGIRGFASILSDYSDRLSREEIKDITAQIESGVDHLVKLTEDLLSLSRLDEGRLELSLVKLSLNDFLTEVATTAALRWEGLEIELTKADSSPVVMADAIRVRQVITNLVDNAVKYAPGGAVKIAVWTENGQALVTVRDHGPGVDEENLGRMFEPFERLSVRGDVSGSGLGLAICRGLVEAHGGHIDAALPDGGGLAITVRLPIPDSVPV